MDLNIKQININDITLANYNPRTISDKELKKLENNIKEFGLVDPIIVNLKNNRIVGGHQRYKALKKMGITKLNMLQFGGIGWVFNETNMNIKNDDDEKILNLSLNNISGTWDDRQLNKVLQGLKSKGANFKLSGFDDLDLERLKIDTEVLVGENLLRDTVDQMQDTNDEGYDEYYEEEDESEELQQLHDGIIKDDYFKFDDTIPCPHCGKPVDIGAFAYDPIDRADGL